MTSSPFLPGHTYPMRGGGEFYVDAVGADRLYGWQPGTTFIEARYMNGCAFSKGGNSYRDLIHPAPEPLTGECWVTQKGDGTLAVFMGENGAKIFGNSSDIRTAVRCRFVEVGE